MDPEAQNRDAHAALAVLQLHPDADLEIRVRGSLCEYQAERDLAAAQDQARLALALLPRARDPGLYAAILTCQGNIRATAGDSGGALQILTLAVSEATAVHADGRLAAALFSRGHLLGVKGEYASALSDLQHAQALFERLGRAYDAVACRGAVATLYRRMGDTEQAAHLYREALRLQQQTGMMREQSVTLQDLGRTYEESGQWALAHAAFSQTLNLARALKYARIEAYALRGLAAVKIAHSDATGALDDLARAAVLQSQTSDARLAAQINLQRGRALRLVDRLPESVTALQAARAVFVSADSTAELAATDGELALVDAALGEWRAAYLAKSEATQYQEQLLSRQLDQRFETQKLEFNKAAQTQENRSLLRENAANIDALSQSRRVRQLQVVIIAMGVALGTVLIGLLIFNRARARRMGSLALTDELTQVPNRRAVLGRLGDLLKTPEARPCAILIMDIDFFKRVNDQHGHAAGDEVLKLVAGAVRTTATEPAFYGRLGGRGVSNRIARLRIDGRPAALPNNCARASPTSIRAVSYPGTPG